MGYYAFRASEEPGAIKREHSMVHDTNEGTV